MILKKPSAFLPVLMSAGALTCVVVFLALHGVTRQPDEGAAAHIWQLLMGGQVPIVLYFAMRWVPEAGRPAVVVLVLQIVAAVAAAAPVFLLGW